MATTLRPAGLDDKSGWTALDPTATKYRVWIGALVLLLAFLGLLARLWFLQIASGASFLAQAQRNRVRRVPLPAPRGLIVDRNGRVLVTSRATHSIAVVPAALPSRKKESDKRDALLRTLGYLLGITPAEIEARIAEALDPKNGGTLYDPVRIADRIDLKTITLIEENKPRLGPAVLVTDEITRFYPGGAFAAHVLGYTGPVDQNDIEESKIEVERDPKARRLKFDDSIGVIGVENEYDTQLAGTSGSALYEVDAKLQPVRRLETIGEKAGNTLVLTLDAKIQKAAEDALKKARNSGAAVAIDVRTGEVLALASNPSFDPNIFSLARRDPRRTAEINHIFESEKPEKQRTKKYVFNRAVTSHYAPGSTFKMVTASAGLEKGAIVPSSTFSCGGGLRLGRFFGCWKTHGAENLYGAIANSCDVYFYQTALRLGNPESSGPEYLAKVARGFGLGQKTGIDLPTDGDGLIPDPEWRKEINKTRPDLARWFPGNTLNMSIGQGDVLATPLQMALVASAVANGGTLWKPHLMKAIRNSSGKIVSRYKVQGKSVGIAPEYLRDVRLGMRQVVTSGTGRAITLPQVSIAGKTGSAEDDNHGLPHAWWVCFAPYENPRIAIAVIVENSGHGSENAVPIAKQMLEAAFPAKASTPVLTARR
jgi:penicillin-binding protein 2